jgi:hypothetical protein
VAELHAQGAASHSNGVEGAAKPFSVAALFGPISQGNVTLDQAQMLQRVIQCMREPAQQGISNLLAMKPAALQEALNAKDSVMVQDVGAMLLWLVAMLLLHPWLTPTLCCCIAQVVLRLKDAIDPVKAHQAFGSSWDYSGLTQAPAAPATNSNQGVLVVLKNTGLGKVGSQGLIKVRSRALSHCSADNTLQGLESPADAAAGCLPKLNALATLQGQLAALGASGGLAGLQAALLMANRASMAQNTAGAPSTGQVRMSSGARPAHMPFMKMPPVCSCGLTQPLRLPCRHKCKHCWLRH